MVSLFEMPRVKEIEKLKKSLEIEQEKIKKQKIEESRYIDVEL